MFMLYIIYCIYILTYIYIKKCIQDISLGTGNIRKTNGTRTSTTKFLHSKGNRQQNEEFTFKINYGKGLQEVVQPQPLGQIWFTTYFINSFTGTHHAYSFTIVPGRWLTRRRAEQWGQRLAGLQTLTQVLSTLTQKKFVNPRSNAGLLLSLGTHSRGVGTAFQGKCGHCGKAALQPTPTHSWGAFSQPFAPLRFLLCDSLAGPLPHPHLVVILM